MAATALLLAACGAQEPPPDGGASSPDATRPTQDAAPAAPVIDYPLDGTIFPPDIAPPTFRWQASSEPVDSFLVAVGSEDDVDRVAARTRRPQWTPSEEQWSAIRGMSMEQAVAVTISEHHGRRRGGSASIEISTSGDAVGAPLFYREVNLPFIDAVGDPSKIRWRFGSVSSLEPPPVVLEKLPVCGNCHSFSADGTVLGMDVDYANDKGSYVITRVSEEIVLDRPSVITWSDYARDDGQLTFGLLSQVSPDGRHVISTVKDRSVFVPMPDLAFSQLFFPVKGILVSYDRQEKRFQSLPGADDPAYVQSNPAWSPDGKQVVFARSKAHELEGTGREVLISPEAAREFTEGRKLFKFDLYRVPWNGGKGGRPEPLPGASHNGMSNYFARYSPDGRWIVFCKSRSFMLLQPDSELYIMPAEGGEPRRMRCNTSRMNSWHSWSPNGRWLVFSAKPDGPYTQLMLTHIDEEGRSSPPVVLDRMTASKRAANIPEFVAARPDGIKMMHQRFVDETSYMRAGTTAMDSGAPEAAERAFRKALTLNPDHADTLNNLGFMLMQRGENAEARGLFERAVKSRPGHIKATNNLSAILMQGQEWVPVAKLLADFTKLRPDNAIALCNLGTALVNLGEPRMARAYWKRSLRHDPELMMAHCNLGTMLHEQGEHAAASAHLSKCRRTPPPAAPLRR